jgi:LacI family transcriptional regulator
MTTIRDVAKSAGVSPITVSRVVNRLENVNPDTRARVEKAIEELGYVRNLAASSLRSKETYTLALILPDITNTFWTTVARGVEDAAQSDGYSVLLCNTDENPDKFTKYLNAVLQQRVDGVMVVPVRNDSLHLSRLGAMKVPTVVLDRRVPDWEGDSVYCDSIASAQALVQHLLTLGHTRIAIISGPATTSTAEDRVAGYCLALYKAGIEVDQGLIWRGEYRASSGRAMTRELLASGANPTAILATNNAIAAGVLEELKNQGKNVPVDMALVCFDEVPEMERFFPFLTSVTQPAYDMGINATQMLLSRINANGPFRARQVVLPTRLILRYSCGRFLKTSGPEAGTNFTMLPDVSSNQLVMPLAESDRELLLTCVPGFTSSAPKNESELPDRMRLVRALNFEKTDRIPYLDGRGAGKHVMESALGHTVRRAADRLNILAEDAVEFARQMGIDAVACEFSWQTGPLSYDPDGDLAGRARQAFPAPALSGQLSMLENLLNAAQGSGVGVYARFSGFVDNALKTIETGEAGQNLKNALSRHGSLEKLMDMLVKHQERVMRAVCDRFGRDLCFISIQDDALGCSELVANTDLFQNTIIPRLARMVTPAREHGLPVGLDTRASGASLKQALPALHKAGVRIIQFSNPDADALESLARAWHGKVVMMGGLPVSRLGQLSRTEIDEQLRRSCKKFSKKTGFVFSTDAPVSNLDDFPPQNFINMLRAIQRYGKF